MSGEVSRELASAQRERLSESDITRLRLQLLYEPPTRPLLSGVAEAAGVRAKHCDCGLRSSSAAASSGDGESSAVRDSALQAEPAEEEDEEDEEEYGATPPGYATGDMPEARRCARTAGDDASAAEGCATTTNDDNDDDDDDDDDDEPSAIDDASWLLCTRLKNPHGLHRHRGLRHRGLRHRGLILHVTFGLHVNGLR